MQITCLYDMDIVFAPDGNFDEVYLYVRLTYFGITQPSLTTVQEELMEADLHAIVRSYAHNCRMPSSLLLPIDQVWATSL